MSTHPFDVDEVRRVPIDSFEPALDRRAPGQLAVPPTGLEPGLSHVGLTWFFGYRPEPSAPASLESLDTLQGGRVPESRPGGFSDVDRQQETAFYFQILEAQDKQPGIMAARAAALRMLNPQPGWRVLDAGAGTGTAAREIAALVAPEGRVVALDFSEQMLDVAATRASESGISLEIVHGNVSAMEFENGMFDGARSERVFQHLEAPEQALGEMIRVVHPGGRIVVVDSDWDSLTLDLPDLELAVRLRAASLRRFANPTAGRRLYGMFKRAGLENVGVEAIPVLILEATLPGTDLRLGEWTVRHAVEDGGITAEEGDRILEQMRQAEAEDAILRTFVMYAVVGTKP